MVVATINKTAPAFATDFDEGQERLWDLLDRWMTLDETRATWQEVEDLYRAIVDLWRAHSDDAEGWYEAWRAARPPCLA